jgi:ABC-2 type transport system ATP-binding protein
MEENMMAMIEVQHITRRYHEVDALKGISLSVRQGAVFGFLGPNGAGKTTLIKILAGLIKPTLGSFRINGVTNAATKKYVGYLAQHPSFYPWMTGRELLRFSGELYGMSSTEIGQRILELLELCGIQHAADRRIGGYSGGMVQRLGIAQAILHRPRVTLLDEPVSALDPVGRKEVLELITRLREETTIFMSSHILEDVQRVCDEVAIVSHGSIILHGEVKPLLQSHARPRMSLEFATSTDARAFLALMASQSVVGAAESDFRVAIAEDDYRTSYPNIMRMLAEHDLRVVSIGRQSATLEDVFMHHIEERNHA